MAAPGTLQNSYSYFNQDQAEPSIDPLPITCLIDLRDRDRARSHPRTLPRQRQRRH